MSTFPTYPDRALDPEHLLAPRAITNWKLRYISGLDILMVDLWPDRHAQIEARRTVKISVGDNSPFATGSAEVTGCRL